MICDSEKILETIKEIMNKDDGTYEKWLSSAQRQLNIMLTGKLKNKYEAKDVVHCLIDKLYTGKRKWDCEKYPDFKIYFFMLIRSHISNLADFEEKYVDVNDYRELDEECDNIPFFETNHFKPLRDILSEKDAKELEKLSLDALGNDEDASIVFCYLIDGLQNSKIAEELGVDKKFVESAKKRIKRKLLPIFEEFFGRGIPVKL